jgi:bifunctional NMN adenylyltransferase/nudix hydrolase
MRELEDIGVVIGRFQIHELHEAHETLIGNVVKTHKRVIIFLGTSPVPSTKRNPLDFHTRKAMIEDTFPNVVVVSLPDFSDDDRWSKELDSRIREIFPFGEVLLYGGRDSFLGHYKGGFKSTELEQDTFVSGTEVRKNISKEMLKSKDFRSGVIYSTYNRYPIIYSKVNAVIFNEDKSEILLAKKPNESKWKFVGGFVLPIDNSDEDATKRKVIHETGLEIDDIQYVTSMKIDDWRYRNSGDSVTTRLFSCKKVFGRVTPSDDISECKWFNVSELTPDLMMDEQKPLMAHLIQKLTN